MMNTSLKRAANLLLLPDPAIAYSGYQERPADSGWTKIDDYQGSLTSLRRHVGLSGQLTLPLCADPARLGPKRSATLRDVQLGAFVEASHEALSKIVGAKMRGYYQRVGLGGAVSFEALTRPNGVGGIDDQRGIDTKKLEHLYEYFYSLRSIDAQHSLGKPELLRVAALFLGDNSEPPLSFSRLQEMAQKRLITLRGAIQAIRERARGDDSGTNAEVLSEMIALCRLVQEIHFGLKDEDIRALLTPPPTLTDTAKHLGYSAGVMAQSGLTALAGKALRYMQGPSQATGQKNDGGCKKTQ